MNRLPTNPYEPPQADLSRPDEPHGQLERRTGLVRFRKRDIIGSWVIIYFILSQVLIVLAIPERTALLSALQLGLLMGSGLVVVGMATAQCLLLSIGHEPLARNIMVGIVMSLTVAIGVSVFWGTMPMRLDAGVEPLHNQPDNALWGGLIGSMSTMVLTSIGVALGFLLTLVEQVRKRG